MGNRHFQDSAFFGQPGKWGTVIFKLQADRLAQKQERAIPD
jgi:hypothetical protein